MEKTFNLQPDTLEDGLIELKPLKQEDFERLYAVASDPLIWELHPTKDRYKKDVFKIYFDGAVASNSSLLVFDKKTKEPIGCTRFYYWNQNYSKIAIGYTFLARKYWGGDYNKSMKKLLIDYAFQFVDSVLFHVGTENIRSQKAVLKIGGKKTNEVDFDNKGKITHYEYEIKKERMGNLIAFNLKQKWNTLIRIARVAECL